MLKRWCVINSPNKFQNKQVLSSNDELQYKPSQLGKLIILIIGTMVHKSKNYNIKRLEYYFYNTTNKISINIGSAIVTSQELLLLHCCFRRLVFVKRAPFTTLYLSLERRMLPLIPKIFRGGTSLRSSD